MAANARKPTKRSSSLSRSSLATRLTGVGFWSRDLASGLEQWDARVCEMYGVPHTDGLRPAITESPEHFVAPADRERLDAALAQAPDGMTFGECRFHLVRPDGSMVALRMAWEHELDAQAQPIRLLGVLTDETPTDELSHRSDLLSTRLDESLSLANVGCWHVRLSDNQHFWDERCCEIAGIPFRASGFTADEVHERLDPASRDTIRAALAKALVSDEPVEFEYGQIRPSGEHRRVLVRQLRERDSAGKVVRLFGAALDVTDQRRRESQLSEALGQIEAALSLGKVGFWRKDLLTHEVTWNGPVRAIYGLSEGEEPSQERFEAMLEPDDLQRLQQLDLDLLENRASKTEYSTWILHPSGEKRYIYSAAHVVRNAASEPVALAGVVVDLTSERAALQLADASAQRMALALELGQLATFRMDLATGRETLNERCWEILGLPPQGEGIHLNSIASLAASDSDAAIMRAADERAVETGSSGQYQYSLLRPDGQQRRVLCSTTLERDASGRATHLYGVAADITSHFEQADAYREMAVRFARACDAAGIGVFDRDLTRGLSVWNEQLYRLYGLPVGSATGPEVLDTIMSAADAEARRNAVRRLVTGEAESAALRFAITRPSDGAQRTLEMKFLPQRGVHDLVVRIIGTVIDVTDQAAGHD